MYDAKDAIREAYWLRDEKRVTTDEAQIHTELLIQMEIAGENGTYAEPTTPEPSMFDKARLLDVAGYKPVHAGMWAKPCKNHSGHKWVIYPVENRYTRIDKYGREQEGGMLDWSRMATRKHHMPIDDRRKYERVYSYAWGDSIGTVSLDRAHLRYRIDVRENGKMVYESYHSSKREAMRIARDSVNYLNKRGV